MVTLWLRKACSGVDMKRQRTVYISGKQLLVGSAFRDALPDQLQWLDLQLRFLKASTPEFDHVSFVNGKGAYAEEEEPELGDIAAFDQFDTKVVGIGEKDTTSDPSPTSSQHIHALNELLSYFKEQRHNYAYFLFLDNDAFPIRNGWLPTLVTKMGEHDKSVAAVIRSENLETRWHASVLLVEERALDSLDFTLHSVDGGDLMGVAELDVGIGPFQDELRKQVLPLIRTNQFNLHPVAYGIYFDMFYHHTFGSQRYIKDGRNVGLPWSTLRWGRSHYADHYINPEYPWKQYNQDLLDDPSGFVSKLAGWNPETYVSVEPVVGTSTQAST